MQLLESQLTCNSLINENQQLKAGLDRAVATTSELAGSLRDNEAALHALIAKESGDLKNEDDAENSYEGTWLYLLQKSIFSVSVDELFR